MALDLLHNFVSPQYLEIKLTEFHKILYIEAPNLGKGMAGK